jgi:DNA-binding CsgD family transcriptional regulator
VSTILGVARGEFSCSPRFAAVLIHRVRPLPQERAPAAEDSRLTPRERGILSLVDEGLSNKEIATRLGIEVCTVKNPFHLVLEKLHATRRSQAAARARSSRAELATASPYRRPGRRNRIIGFRRHPSIGFSRDRLARAAQPISLRGSGTGSVPTRTTIRSFDALSRSPAFSI